MAVRRIAGRNVTAVVADGVIQALEPGDPAERSWVSAGFVDLQVNGYRGLDLNAPGPTPALVSKLVAAVRASGTTSFLPTVITAGEDRMVAALAAIAAACRADPDVAAAIAGIHVEGPHISPQDGPRGAHPLAEVRPPDLALFDRWQAAAGGLVRIVTLSPHWPDAAHYIAALAARGVRVALGHTDATPAAIDAAAAAGATMSTHLGNGIAATLPRHPNILWTQLADDRLTATLIADGHHLPADTLKAMIRAKGADRAILVSDVTALGGRAPGVYSQAIGGEVDLSADGRISLRGTPYLAGAALPLAAGVAVAAGLVGLEAALPLATANPGRMLGDGRGVLAVGRRADLVRFAWSPGDRALAIDLILAQGREVAPEIPAQGREVAPEGGPR